MFKIGKVEKGSRTLHSSSFLLCLRTSHLFHLPPPLFLDIHLTKSTNIYIYALLQTAGSLFDPSVPDSLIIQSSQLYPAIRYQTHINPGQAHPIPYTILLNTFQSYVKPSLISVPPLMSLSRILNTVSNLQTPKLC